MNPRLGLLQPYPFERLRVLLAGATPPADLRPISLGLGEPQHPTPALIKDALAANLGTLSRYPVTLGLPELRAAMAEWIDRKSTRLNSSHQIISYAVFCLKKKNKNLRRQTQVITYPVFCVEKKNNDADFRNQHST